MKWSALDAIRLAMLLGALHLLPSVAWSAETIEARYNALAEVEDQTAGALTTRERGLRVSESYDLHFGGFDGHDLGGMSIEDLRLYLQATELVLLYAVRPQDLRRMEVAFDEMSRRGESDQATVGMMHRAYISLRRFDQARALARRHKLDIGQTDPGYADMVAPGYRGPTLLKVSPDAAELTRMEFTPPEGRHIVVVSHPLCHFSNRAIAAIDEDPVLRDLFKDNAVWLAPVDGRLNFDVIQSWNADRPQYPVSIAFSRDEWPDIDYWGTPAFYFFGEAGLVGKVVGWPREGRRAELLEAADKAGLRAKESPVPE